jgi:hypothetical protein
MWLLHWIVHPLAPVHPVAGKSLSYKADGYSRTNAADATESGSSPFI